MLVGASQQYPHYTGHRHYFGMVPRCWVLVYGRVERFYRHYSGNTHYSSGTIWGGSNCVRYAIRGTLDRCWRWNNAFFCLMETMRYECLKYLIFRYHFCFLLKGLPDPPPSFSCRSILYFEAIGPSYLSQTILFSVLVAPCCIQPRLRTLCGSAYVVQYGTGCLKVTSKPAYICWIG